MPAAIDSASVLPDVIASPGVGEVDQVVALLRRGLFLQAFAVWPEEKLLSAVGWEDARAVTNAARLAERLGGRKLAARLHWVNWRRHPEDPVCLLYRASLHADRAGVVPALALIEARLAADPEIYPKHRADLANAALSYCLAMRDFTSAEKYREQVLVGRPADDWPLTTAAGLRRAQDRREEALELCDQALAVNPDYDHALHLKARLLQELGRTEEMTALLLEKSHTTEISDLCRALHAHHSERDEPEEALAWLEEVIRRSPLRSPEWEKSLHGSRASLLLLLGRLEEARTEALAAGSGFFEQMAKNLALPGAASACRVRLPVAFVQQHHLTCAPATLTALGQYWGAQVDHVELSEKICYDGTPSHSQRAWARDQGLDGREFTVTWDVARQLIDRGIPFTMVSSWSEGSHLHAVIGYDARAATFILRDPTFPHYTEALAENFLKDQAAFGPRAMLVLSAAECGRVDGVELPEAEIYDLLHALDAALQRHDRTAAQSHWEAMTSRYPGHRLTWQGLVALAGYDQDVIKSDHAMEQLAALFPENAHCTYYGRLSKGRRLPREENVAEWARRCREKDGADAVFWLEYARMLTDDSRTAWRAERIARRLLRRNPGQAESLRLLGIVNWVKGNFDTALRYYRWAACAADKTENNAVVHTEACESLGRTAAAAAFLEERTASLGRLSPQPWLTLVDLRVRQCDHNAAQAVLAEARRLFPKSGELLLCSASLARSMGDPASAEAFLHQAQPLASPQAHHRESALTAEIQGEPLRALAHWQAVLSTEPVVMDAHVSLTRLLAETSGVDAALESLAKRCAEFPWHAGLAELHVQWLRREGSRQAETALRTLLERQPANHWAWRELALELSRQGRHAEAVAAAEESLALAPWLATSSVIAGHVHQVAEQASHASTYFRAALELDVSVGVMAPWLRCLRSPEERREAVAFLEKEMERQSTGGAATGEFFTAVGPWVEPEEMTRVLRQAHRARPDVFETWGTLIDDLRQQRSPEALDLARQLTVRFRATPGSWRCLAQVYFSLDRPEEQLQALVEAVARNPQWTQAGQDLAQALERAGRPEEALVSLRELIRRHPLDPVNYGLLAETLLRTRQRKEAISALEQALDLEPSYDWAWRNLISLAVEQNQPELVTAISARQLVARPDEAARHTTHAQTLLRLEQPEEAQKIAGAALERWPRDVPLRTILISALEANHNLPEALRACRPEIFGMEIPRQLRLREARLLLDSGDFFRAEPLLRKLSDAEPDFAQPRLFLHQIRREARDWPDCLRLAQELVRLEPESAIIHGMLAEDLLQLNRTAEALPAARRALELDPGYIYAANAIAERLLQAGDTAAARQLWQGTRHFQQDGNEHYLGYLCAEAEHNPDEMELHVTALLQKTTPEAEDAVARISLRPSFPRSIGKMVVQAVEEGQTANRGASHFWARKQPLEKPSPTFLRAVRLPLATENNFLAHTLKVLLDELSDVAGSQTTLDAIFPAHRDLLQSHTQLWGAMTYLLVKCWRIDELCAWGRDWASRKDREPWMVSNYAIGVLVANGPKAAEAAWRDIAAAGKSAEDVWYQSAIGLALIHAWRGEREPAVNFLKNVPDDQLKGIPGYLAALAKASLNALKIGPTPIPDELAKIKARFHEAADAEPGDRRLVLSCQNGLAKFLKDHGLPASWLELAKPKVRKYATQKQKTPNGCSSFFPLRILGISFFILAGILREGCKTKERNQPAPFGPSWNPPRKATTPLPQTFPEIDPQFKPHGFPRQDPDPRPRLDPSTPPYLPPPPRPRSL